MRHRPRWWVIVLIALLHIGVFYALMRALAPDLTASVERDVTSAFTVTITTPEEKEPDPPPPPPQEQKPEPEEGAQGAPGKKAKPKPVAQPTPKVPLKQDKPAPRATSTGKQDRSGARDEGEGTGAAGQGEGTGSGNEGTGSGSEGNGSGPGRSLLPVTKPSVASGELNTASDFPVPQGGRRTRFGKSVTVAFTVTTDGRAKNCSVLRSQVDPQTTAAVCPLVMQKIRFKPATNNAGEPVEARYGYKVDFSAR